MDKGVVQRCGQQTSTPGDCIPVNPDRVMYGDICPNHQKKSKDGASHILERRDHIRGGQESG